jgi:hypothetical protein
VVQRIIRQSSQTIATWPMFLICLTTSGIMALLKMIVAQAMVAHHGKPTEVCSEFSSASNQSVGHPTPDATEAALADEAAVAAAGADWEAASAAMPRTVPEGTEAVTGAAIIAAPADDTLPVALAAPADDTLPVALAAPADDTLPAALTAAAGGALNQPNRRTQTPGEAWFGEWLKCTKEGCNARADAAMRKTG